MIDDHELDALGADQSLKLGDLARSEQSRRPRVRQRYETMCPHVEIDGAR
jgi:hypothetical protein